MIYGEVASSIFRMMIIELIESAVFLLILIIFAYFRWTNDTKSLRGQTVLVSN